MAFRSGDLVKVLSPALHAGETGTVEHEYRDSDVGFFMVEVRLPKFGRYIYPRDLVKKVSLSNTATPAMVSV